MALFSDEQQSNLKLFWFTVTQPLYSFPPIQRFLLVFGVLALIPGYWVTRIATTAYYEWDYGRRAVAAHMSFVNPRTPTVDASDIFELSGGRYLAYAKITNQNLDLAGYTIPYTLTVQNADRERVYSTSGNTFVLPGEAQYIATSAFRSQSPPVSVTVEFGEIHWQKRLAIPEVRLATPAVTYSDAIDGLRLEGSVMNNSPYELTLVRLTFIIENRAGAVVGVTQRDELSVRPNARRTFPQVWPGGIAAQDVGKITSIASTNVLDARNLNVEAGSIARPADDDE